MLTSQKTTAALGAVFRGYYFSGRAPLASAMCPEAMDTGLQLPFQPQPVVDSGQEAMGAARALSFRVSNSGSAFFSEENCVFNTNMMCKLTC